MNRPPLTYSSFIEWSVAILLFAYPAVFLLLKGAMNGALFLLVLMALITWIRQPSDLHSPAWESELWSYIVAMFGLTVAILISQLANDGLLARPYDAASRLWLGVPVFWLLLRLRASIFSVVQYSFPIAAILCWLFSSNQGAGYTLPGLNKILYGDYMLLFGALSLFSVNWFERDGLFLKSLKYAGFAFGLLGAMQSGTRGALLAIPVFVVIYLRFRRVRFSFKMLGIGFGLGLVVIGIAYLSNQTVQDRLQELSNDIITYQQGNRDTSTGQRWQLNVAGIEIFLDHPLAGVGPEVVGGDADGFAKAIQKMYEQGKLTKVAAEVGMCCHVHNEILAKAADLGLPGLVAVLSLYLIPFHLFWKAIKRDSAREKRYAGMLGMIFVSAHFVSGLTVGLLGLTMTSAFYSLGIATLLAVCYNNTQLKYAVNN